MEEVEVSVDVYKKNSKGGLHDVQDEAIGVCNIVCIGVNSKSKNLIEGIVQMFRKNLYQED